MDEQNCTKEYRGIERNVEMVVQEGVAPTPKFYNHQHEI